MVTVSSRPGEQDVHPCVGCEAIAMDLSAYFDNELGPAEAAQVKHHLEHCADCRKKLEGMQHMRDAFAALARPAESPRRSILQSLRKILSRTS